MLVHSRCESEGTFGLGHRLQFAAGYVIALDSVLVDVGNLPGKVDTTKLGLGSLCQTEINFPCLCKYDFL